MPNLQQEIDAYQKIQSSLESEHFGKWALVYNRELVGIYSSFEEAAGVAAQRFGVGPYLIRQIGDHSINLPIAAMYVSI